MSQEMNGREMGEGLGTDLGVKLISVLKFRVWTHTSKQVCHDDIIFLTSLPNYFPFFCGKDKIFPDSGLNCKLFRFFFHCSCCSLISRTNRQKQMYWYNKSSCVIALTTMWILLVLYVPGNSEKSWKLRENNGEKETWIQLDMVTLSCSAVAVLALGLLGPLEAIQAFHYLLLYISSKTFKALAFFSPLRLTSFQGLQDPVGTFCIASAFITLSHQRVALLLFTLSSKLCSSIWSHDAPDIFLMM